MGYTIHGKVDTLEEFERLRIKSEQILFTPKPKSVAFIVDENYKTMLPVDQYFNLFQKLMWKWCFGVKIEDYNEE